MRNTHSATQIPRSVIESILKGVDKDGEIDIEVADIIAHVASDFVESIIRECVKIVKHRGSDTVDAASVMQWLQKSRNLTITLTRAPPFAAPTIPFGMPSNMPMVSFPQSMPLPRHVRPLPRHMPYTNAPTALPAAGYMNSAMSLNAAQHIQGAPKFHFMPTQPNAGNMIRRAPLPMPFSTGAPMAMGSEGIDMRNTNEQRDGNDVLASVPVKLEP